MTSREITIDTFKLLTETGATIEKALNQLIQTQLNHKDALRNAKVCSTFFSSIIKNLQELVEVLSIPLNIPTKSDVANVSKMTTQLEEKLDRIEEHVTHLVESLTDKSVQNQVDSLPTEPEVTSDTVENHSEELENALQRAKLLKENMRKLNKSFLQESVKNAQKYLDSKKQG
jgi:hypothetical protein